MDPSSEYESKLKGLQPHIPNLERVLRNIRGTEEKEKKIQTLYDIVSGKRKVNLADLLKCESVVRKLVKPQPAVVTTEAASATDRVGANSNYDSKSIKQVVEPSTSSTFRTTVKQERLSDLRMGRTSSHSPLTIDETSTKPHRSSNEPAKETQDRTSSTTSDRSASSRHSKDQQRTHETTKSHSSRHTRVERHADEPSNTTDSHDERTASSSSWRHKSRRQSRDSDASSRHHRKHRDDRHQSRDRDRDRSASRKRSDRASRDDEPGREHDSDASSRHHRRHRDDRHQSRDRDRSASRKRDESREMSSTSYRSHSHRSSRPHSPEAQRIEHRHRSRERSRDDRRERSDRHARDRLDGERHHHHDDARTGIGADRTTLASSSPSVASEPSTSSFAAADDVVLVPAANGAAAAARKSEVFKRLGEKVAPKSYDNLNIAVRKKNLPLTADTEPISAEEMQDTHERFGSTSSAGRRRGAQLPKIEYLEQMRQKLLNDLASESHCAQLLAKSAAKRAPPEPTTAVPDDGNKESMVRMLQKAINDGDARHALTPTALLAVRSVMPDVAPLTVQTNAPISVSTQPPDAYSPTDRPISPTAMRIVQEMYKKTHKASARRDSPVERPPLLPSPVVQRAPLLATPPPITLASMDAYDPAAAVPVSPTALMAVQHVMAAGNQSMCMPPVRNLPSYLLNAPPAPPPQHQQQQLQQFMPQPQPLFIPNAPTTANHPSSRDPRLQSMSSKSPRSSASLSLNHPLNATPAINPYTSPVYPNINYAAPPAAAPPTARSAESHPQSYGEYRRAKQRQSAGSRAAHHEAPPSNAAAAVQQSKRTNPPPVEAAPTAGLSSAPGCSNTAIKPVSRSQFDDVYRVGNYDKLKSNTSASSSITQSFKIPKKKSTTTSTSATTSATTVVDEPEHVEEASAQTPSTRQKAASGTAKKTKKSSQPKPREKSRWSRSRSAEPPANNATALPATNEVSSTSTAATQEAAAAVLLADRRRQSTADSEVSSSCTENHLATTTMTAGLASKSTPAVLNEDDIDEDSLLTMLSKVVDASKLDQIRQIMAGQSAAIPAQSTATPASADDTVAVTEQSSTTTASSSPDDDNADETSAASPSDPMPKAKRRRARNELQKLHEDIRTMFICDDVLTASGRRLCTVKANDRSQQLNTSTESERSPTPSPVKVPKSNAAAAAVVEKRTKRVMQRRNTICLIETPPDAAATKSTLSTPKRKPSQPMPAKATARKRTAPSAAALRRIRCNSDGETDADQYDLPTATVVLTRLSAAKILELVRQDSAGAAAAAAAAASGGGLLNAAHLPDALILKNTNTEMHALNPDAWRRCLLCPFANMRSMLVHYANEHRNAENYLSRVSPQMGARLRSKRAADRLDDGVIVPQRTHNKIQQMCIFCEQTQQHTLQAWVSHYSSHTGEYTFQCTVCDRLSAHRARCGCPIGAIQRRPLPQFSAPAHLTAFVCALCNYTQFERSHVERHLRNQHGLSTAAVETGAHLTAVDCMRVGRHKGAAAPAAADVKIEEQDDDGDADEERMMAKRSRKRNRANAIDDEEPASGKRFAGLPDYDDDEMDAVAAGKRSVDSEPGNAADAFVSNAHADEAVATVSQVDAMQLMQNIAFSATTTTTTKRTGDVAAKPIQKGAADGVSMAARLAQRFRFALTDDAGDDDDISIENVPVVEAVRAAPHANAKSPAVAGEDASMIIKSSPQFASASQHSDIVDDVAECTRPAAVVNDEDDGWEDYISDDDPSHSASSLKTPAATTASSPSVGSQKNTIINDIVQRLSRSISFTRLTTSGSSTASAASPAHSETVPKVEVDSPGLKIACVETMSLASFEQPDATVKTINRVANIGYSMCSNRLRYCCLVNECRFESPMLFQLSSHLKEHTGLVWSGFCFLCDRQINTSAYPLDVELQHMKTVHIMSDPQSDTKAKLLCKPKMAAASAAAAITPAGVSQLKITNVISLNKSAATVPEPTNAAASRPTTAPARPIAVPPSDRYTLKPWLKPSGPKTLTAYTGQLQAIGLYALFKCMAPDCAFTNDNKLNALAHLRRHNHRDASTNKTAAAAVAPRPWLECAYCELQCDTAEALVQHTEMVHRSSIFQCPYCFYRSCTAYNVLMHQAAIHAEHVTSVLVCLGKTKALSAELPLIHAARAQHVQQLQCESGCRQRFYTMDAFMNHLQLRHNNVIDCPLCSRTVGLSAVRTHMQFEHNLGQYACLYCTFGANDHNVLRNHMWRQHPTKLLYVMVRLRLANMLNSTVPTHETDTLDETVLAYIGDSVAKTCFKYCKDTYNEAQLSHLSAEELADLKPYRAASPADTRRSNASPTAGTLEIVGVNSISMESFKAHSTKSLLSDVSTRALTQDMIKNVKDVVAYLSQPKNASGSGEMPQKAKLEKDTSARAGAAASTPPSPPQPVANDAMVKTSTSPDLVQREIAAAALALVTGTGLEGVHLYRCAEPSCPKFAAQGPGDFMKHMAQLHAANTKFRCAHCAHCSDRRADLALHLLEHSQHRIFCYFCDYTAPVFKDLQQHMQDTHRKLNLHKTELIESRNHTDGPCMLVVSSHQLSGRHLHQFGLNLLNRYKRRTNKHSYAPNEIDLLPRASTLSEAISCSQCHYATKVRSNMLRHLATCKEVQSPGGSHSADDAKSAVLPIRLDAVNPVPCLDTGEMHFDRMRNLAGSSNEEQITVDEKKVPPVDDDAERDLSVFVPAKDRFVCNARGCRYQTIDEAMLRNHLTTLHPDESTYYCPHCAQNLGGGQVNHIIQHLRLHDSRLFKCSRCSFHHSKRAMVDMHVSKVHAAIHPDCVTLQLLRKENANTVSSIAIQFGAAAAAATPKSAESNSSGDWLDASSHAANATTSSSESSDSFVLPSGDAAKMVYKWKCMMCTESYPTRMQIMRHASKVHSISAQYQCVECKIQCNYKNVIEEHMATKHPYSTKVAKYFYKRCGTVLSKETTPIWRRDDPHKVKHIRGILLEDENSPQTSPKKPNAKVKQPKRLPKTPSEEDESDDAILDTDDDDVDIESDASVSAAKRQHTNAGGLNDSNAANPVACVRKKNKKVGSDTECAVDPLASDDVKVEHTPTYIYTCKYCPKRMASVDQLYAHWTDVHKFKPRGSEQLNDAEPFMFMVDVNLRCVQCVNFSRIPKRLYRNHQTRFHPNGAVAMAELNNANQCGFCEFNSRDKSVLMEHFTSAHSNAVQVEHNLIIQPLVPISEVSLWQLLSVGPQKGVHTCEHCRQAFPNVDDFERHHRAEHAALPSKADVVPDGERFCCTICDVTEDTEQSIVQHLQLHKMYKFHKKYQCVYCEASFGSKVSVRDHCIGAHGCNTDEWRLTPIHTRLDVYKRIRIIFANGLVVCKAEVEETKWGDMTDIIKEIEDIEQMELAEQSVSLETGKRKIHQVDASAGATGQPLKTARLSADCT